MLDRDYMKRIAQAEGFDLTGQQLDVLDLYAKLLVEWNEKINLTAITAPDEMAVKHFLDSILLLKYAQIPKGAEMIDVGTGAGFPSLPCCILRPDLKVTLLDSLLKRIHFLEELTGKLNIPAVCLHGRAEDRGRESVFRERCHIAAARAVASLRELAEYCIPFVQCGGLFVALKGAEIDAELQEAKAAIRILGGEISSVSAYTLPDGSRRNAVVIKKISQTPIKYPRMPAQIKKSPIK